MNPKQRAADAALNLVSSGMSIGLGTGTTADCFLQALAASLKSGRLRDIRGIPTSRQSERRAQELGIPLVTLAQVPQTDITIDGADEIAPNLDLIKGLGGALLREKIIAQNSRRMVIIADSGKVVPALGTQSPLPVEVVPFGHESHVAFLRSLGCEPILRRTGSGDVFVTDSGNYIYDCRFDRIDHPRGLEAALCQRGGIVETGFFLGIADLAIIGHDHGIEERHR